MKDEAFWQKTILCQEDRPVDTVWEGIGYRWFKSDNVVCLEHYLRADEPNPTPRQKAS